VAECLNRNGVKHRMSSKWIDRIAFSKAHKELLIQLYRKQIIRSEYDVLVNQLYVLEPKGIAK
jgi:hypothetical protein